LTFDLLTLKVVSESRVTWATSVPTVVFLGLSVNNNNNNQISIAPYASYRGPTYATETDRRLTRCHTGRRQTRITA